MNSSIQEIIALDKTARERTDAASAEAERIAGEAAAEMERLEVQTREAAKAEAEHICDEIREEADRETAQIRQEAEEKCRRLDQAMRGNAEAWRSAILKRILE